MSSLTDTRARIRLDVLGRLSLQAAGADVPAVLVQPKRLALLVWLVLRRPGGFVRRDELLGTFWPDSTEQRARASLRQALLFLRRHLGPDTIVRRGDGEVGVAAGALACDALHFVAAIARGEDESAMREYGGDLLPGFLLDGSHAFDSWLHAERQRLRTMAVEAALRSATQAQDDDDHGLAAERLAWAHTLVPDDEDLTRRLAKLRADAGSRTPPLSPQRILVLELENRTGDPAHDVLCALAAETVARGLADVPDLEVIPPIAARQFAHDAAGADASALDASGLPHVLAELARRAGAGTLLTGSIDREGDAVSFRMRAADVLRGTLLPGPEPVRVDEASPIAAIELLRERVVTAVAPALTRRAVHVRHAARPPSVAAYRAYLDGLERFVQGEWDAACDCYRQSIELSPEYALPRIVSAIALWNLGRLREARATALEAHEMRESLGRFERVVLDMVLAWLRGDWAAAHHASVVQAEMAPGSIPHFQVAEESRRLNHPREARVVLRRLNADAGELRGWIYYWVELATACHMLRDHDAELDAARRCRQIHPHEPLAVLLELRALAGLGRERDVTDVAEQMLASPYGRKPAAGELLVEAALELRAHGCVATGATLMARAVEWYRGASLSGVVDASLHRHFARALFYAERYDEARTMFEQLAPSSAGRVQPVGLHHTQLSAHLDEGFLAAIAAATGAVPELERWCAFLEGLDGPFLYGAQWYWLAVVAALRDDPDRAIRMLRRAFADGMPMEMFVHTDPHLARLAGDERFEAIMRPRG